MGVETGRYGRVRTRDAEGEWDHDRIGTTAGRLAGQPGATRRSHGTIRGQTVRAFHAVIRCRVPPWSVLVGGRWCRPHAGVSRCAQTTMRRSTCRSGKQEKNSREDHGPQAGGTSSLAVIGPWACSHGPECILPARAVSTVAVIISKVLETPLRWSRIYFPLSVAR